MSLQRDKYRSDPDPGAVDRRVAAGPHCHPPDECYDLAVTTSASQILKDALSLSEKERAEVAAQLIASLDAAPSDDADEVREAWAAEIERRCAELDAGTATTEEWEDVRRRIEGAIRRK